MVRRTLERGERSGPEDGQRYAPDGPDDGERFAPDDLSAGGAAGEPGQPGWMPGRPSSPAVTWPRLRSRRPSGNQPSGQESPGRRPSRQRASGGGGGGRWLIWLGRGLAWGLLLLIGYRGIAAILAPRPRPSARSPGAVAAHPSGFPVALGRAYALQFGASYLNYSPAAAAQRASQLAAMLPPGTDPQLGWNGAGSQRLQSEQVAAVRVQNAHHAVITILARVNDGLVELGVPVYAAHGGLAISGEPALLPAPVRASVPQAAAMPADPGAQAALRTVLPSFFRAYAGGGQATLDRFLVPGAHLTGLGGAVSFGSITQLGVPRGGTIRHVTVSVNWQTPATRAGLTMTYQLTVMRRGGVWDVAAIGASTEPPGPP